MPNTSPNAWKCLCFIIRKTKGWQRLSDSLSFSQIKEGTGIKSDPTVTKALKEIEDSGYILVDRHGGQWDSNTYTLNVGLEIEVSPTIDSIVEPFSTIESIVGSTIESVAGSTIESIDTKERKKEKINTTSVRRRMNPKEQARAEVEQEFELCLAELKTLNIPTSSRLESIVKAKYLEITPPKNESRLDWFKYSATQTAVNAQRPTWNYLARVLDNVNGAGSLTQHIADHEAKRQQPAKNGTTEGSPYRRQVAELHEQLRQRLAGQQSAA